MKKKRMPGLPGTTLLLSEQMLGHVSVLRNVDQTLSPSVSLWQPLYVGHCDSWQVDPSLVFEAMICKDARNFPQRLWLIWTWAHHVNSLSGSRNRYKMILTYDGALSCWRQPSEDCTVFIKRWSWSTTILREAVVKKKKSHQQHPITTSTGHFWWGCSDCELTFELVANRDGTYHCSCVCGWHNSSVLKPQEISTGETRFELQSPPVFMRESSGCCRNYSLIMYSRLSTVD